MAMMAPQGLHAQGNYVYVHNQDVASSVSAYSVSPAGVLTPLPGSPYLTGGAGSIFTCFGLDQITVSPAGNFLFVSNGGDQTISVFAINPGNGALTSAPGSPFASGLTLGSCQGISLAATPDGRFLMASSNGQIATFSIAPGGALAPVATTLNPLASTVGMKISANGQLLALANEISVSVFTIHADGSLAPVAGSPFATTGTGILSGLDFSSCASDRLYGGEATGGPASTDAWSVDAGGVLTPVSGSPFSSTGSNSNVVLLSPDNSALFQSNQFSNSINTFTVLPDGSLSDLGGFGGVGAVHLPVGMATDKSGTMLYVADDNFGLAVFKIGGGGSLVALKDAAITGANEIQGVAAYPARVCSHADLALTAAAAPSPVTAGSNITYTINVTNNGPDAATTTLSDILPPTTTFVSCSATGGGVCGTPANIVAPNNRTVSFASLASGQSETVTIVAQSSSFLLNGSSISNTVSIANTSAIDGNSANNSATATVTVSAPLVAASLSLPPVTLGFYGGSTTLTATLRRASNNAPLAGRTVAFTLNGVSVGSASTDANGLATLVASDAGMNIGIYPGAISASFAGDLAFSASSGTSLLEVKPGVLTVVPADLSRTYGDANPPITYTIVNFAPGDSAASIVTGSPVCSTAATAASNVGNYPITCSIGTLATTSSNYTFITLTGVFSMVPGTLAVNPAPLSVSVDNLSRLYGDPNPPFVGAITGLKNGDNITATYTTLATQSSPVGVYAVTPVFVDPANKLGNYAVSMTGGTLTVLPAPLSATADNAGRLYGDPNPVFTGTIAGIKNNDNITATYSSPATPASPVGTYPIVPALVDPTNKLGNYTVAIINGVLTVNPAPLTVTIANASRLYGNANPVFTGTITGLKNGDVITATYSSAATPASPVGTYSIVPTFSDLGNKLGNYSVTVLGGVFTITPAPLTVTINNASRVYGNANPNFSASFTGLRNSDPIAASFSSVDQTASVGTYPITATLVDPAGKLPNYTVTIKNGALTITKAPLTITGFNGQRLYGDPNPAPTITGLKNNDPITATYSASSPTAASPIGTYIMALVVSDPAGKLVNYTLTLQNGTMTINRSPLSVVANSATRPFGSANPAFTGTITGIKNGDNISATFSSAATVNTNAGTVPITSSLSDPTGKLGNYNVSTTNGALIITPVPLSIVANNASMILNATAPTFTAAYSGFVLGQGPANLNGTLSCSANGITIGTHTITCSGQSSTNYTIVFAPGTLTVTYAPVGTCTNGPGHQILAPINVNGSSSFTKATNPSIPVQFRVCDARGAAISSAVVSSFALVQIGQTTVNQAPAASDGRPFTFNGAAQDWVFNLSTANLTTLGGTVYVYQIGLNDGTTISFQFALQ